MNFSWPRAIFRSIPVIYRLFAERRYTASNGKVICIFGDPPPSPDDDPGPVHVDALRRIASGEPAFVGFLSEADGPRGPDYKCSQFVFYSSTMSNKVRADMASLYVSVAIQQTYQHFVSSTFSEAVDTDTMRSELDALNIDVNVLILLNGHPNGQSCSQFPGDNSIFLQLAHVESFMFCVLDHELVPRHEIISPAEYCAFAKSNGIAETTDGLPVILSNDPVAIFIGMYPGELCKITRPSVHTGSSTFFRICKA